MTRARLLALSLAATTTLAACGGSDGTGPTGGGNKSMQASIAGVQWTGNPQGVTASWNQANGILSIGGNDLKSGTNTQININLTSVNGTGTYQLGPSFSGQLALLTVTTGTTPSVWTTALSPANGSVSVTTLTATRAAGTFSFTAQAGPGTPATGQRAVSSGTFDITF